MAGHTYGDSARMSREPREISPFLGMASQSCPLSESSSRVAFLYAASSDRVIRSTQTAHNEAVRSPFKRTRVKGVSMSPPRRIRPEKIPSHAMGSRGSAGTKIASRSRLPDDLLTPAQASLVWLQSCWGGLGQSVQIASRQGQRSGHDRCLESDHGPT